MLKTARIAAASIMLCAIAMPAVAETPTCTGIANNRARLICREEVRRHYRSELESKLTEKGSIAGVYVEETGDFNSGAYPKLIVWSALDRDTVYRLISEAKILDGARGSGFRMVQFTDKGDDGHWFFDLTRPGIWPINIEAKGAQAIGTPLTRP